MKKLNFLGTTGLLLGLYACQQPVSTRDSGADAVTPGDDAATGDAATGDGATNPRLPLNYMPTGCSYMVHTQPGTVSNYLGDTSTFGTDAAGATPTNVHVTWAGDPATTAAVLWSTDAATRATVVQYGTTRDQLTQMATGHVSSTSMGDLTVHEVHLCGLTPGTTYYYQVGGAGHLGDVQSFTTAPAPTDTSAQVVFAVAGDSRDDVNVWRQVQQSVAAQTGMMQPEFQVFSGDAVSLGTAQQLWNDWFTNATSTFSRMPVVMAHGNHDALSINYMMQVAQPQSADANQSELYFSLNYGPMHLIVLNDTVANGDIVGVVGGPERDWLIADLTAVDRTATPWVVVMHHKPCFSSSQHSNDADTRQLRMILPPIYSMYNVDLVLNGHDHDFERTRPLDGTGVPVPSGTHGTVYITAAGAGATLYDAASQPWTQISASVRNYGIVSVSRTALTFSPMQMDMAGNVSPLTGGAVTLNR